MNFLDKEHFQIDHVGGIYSIPKYKAVPNQPIELTGEFLQVPFVNMHVGIEGVLHESLLSMMIADLTRKNSLVPSEETKQMIINLKQALHWARARHIDRTQRNVINTSEE